MKQHSNILSFVTPEGGDLRAVRTAIELAAQSSGRVLATRVIDLDPSAVADWGPAAGGALQGEAWSTFRAEALHQELAILSARLEPLHDPRANLIARVAFGRPSLELIRLVLQENHDLVIKVAAGTNGGRHVAFGSTGLHLVRKCPAPVWLLPHQEISARRMLVALDPGTEGNEAKLAMSRRVLAHALAISRGIGAEVHVVHVHEPPRQLSQGALSDKLSKLVALTERNVVNRLRGVLAELGADVTLHTLHGDPERLIPELASRLEVHTIAMGSLGRGSADGLLVGELAEEVLMRVECGVFCVKPAGFASPIRLRVDDAS